MTKRVFGWTDGSGAYWYRIKIPFDELAATGRWQTAHGGNPWSWNVATRPAPRPDLHEFDVVVGQRIVGACPDWLALCANPNVLTVYDMDDDLLDSEAQHELHAQYAQVAEQTRQNIAAADVVTVCTPYVAEKVRKINPNVHELPICITADVINRPLIVRRHPLTVGWAGAPFRYYDWVGVAEQLREFARRVPHASFHAMGADYSQGAFGERTRFTAFQSYAGYFTQLDFDIGIAPLCKSAFNRGKSHTKALEYGARGVPVVATAWGQYRDWVRHAVNGFLVEEPTDWSEYLCALADDATRFAMATAARMSARAFTIDKHIGLWERAYCGQGCR